MKFLKAPPRLSLIGMAALVLNVGLSGCTTSNSPSMPTTEAQSANVAPAAHLRLAAAPIHESGTGEGDGFGPNQCDSPPFPTVCVPKAKGAYSELGIEVTYGSGPAPGIWTWSATIVDSNGKPTKMVATFSPNPGNPTTETIDWKNAKDDDYTQTIEVCNSSSQCISTTGNVYVFTAGDFSGGLRKVVSAFPDPVSVGVARLDLTNEDGTARGRLDRPDIPFACNKPWWINWEWVCIPFHGSVTE